MGTEVDSMPAAPQTSMSADEDIEHKHEDLDADAEHEADDLSNVKPRKKRRIIKTSDKKYECPESDCGKMYSRAEHLYRHQLNHTPKQIYRCDFPGCDRHFVRADLCARHKERHTAKGSHLQRKDAFMNRERAEAAESSPPSPPGRDTISAPHVEPNHSFQQPIRPAESYAVKPEHVPLYGATNNNYQSHALPDTSRTLHQQHGMSNGMPLDPQLANAGPSNAYVTSSYGATMMPPSTVPDRRYSFDTPHATRPVLHDSGYNPSPPSMAHTAMPPPSSLNGPPPGNGLYPPQPYQSPSSAYRAPPQPSAYYSGLPPLAPFGYSTDYPPPNERNYHSSSMTSTEQLPVPNSGHNGIPDYNVIDINNMNYTMPVFGNEQGFNRSPPLVLTDEFLTSLFGPGGMMADTNVPSPPALEPLQGPPMYNGPLPKLDPDGIALEPLNSNEPRSPTVISGLDITMKESALSEKKRMRLIGLINKRFTDNEKMPDWRSREEIMEGSLTDPDHVMSSKMLKTFISSYWVHVHQQMPIMHRSTFNPETCPDLLLIAMMCLGASCVERSHPPGQAENCAEFSAFLAYHTRWEVFKDVEFRPTAKLWTFQTMLLLELFEKMYSTRSLHERAHIHHATTLIVMRRGSSLIGRSAIGDSPGAANDPTRTPPGPDGSINTSGVNTPDAWWNRWITAEATRRAAFAAFVIDSTHATLFGHSAVMSPHDIKLPLPCDEALWAATSSAEVQRVEASLAANGFKPTTFVDGLKRTLNGQRVRTNTFGRVILMAGLLNVSWHMNQRDLQVSSLSLGNNTTLGNQTKWRAPLTRAFDFWRRDFDDSLSKNEHWLQLCHPRGSTSSAGGTPERSSGLETRDNVFESRTCLHSLAHMAMHVDMIDCTVFAGSERALGRVVTDSDRVAVQRRMREQWAPTARARDAVFYALRFLCEVLIPDDELSSTKGDRPHKPPTFSYSARDDYLLNRPWVLYFAALIVWSYGYALDGPIRPSNYTLTSRELQIYDMQRYLIRVGGVASPDDLEKLKDRNSCLGLLLLLRQCFREPRWELLHEASDLLGNCIDMLLPGHAPGVLSGTSAMKEV